MVAGRPMPAISRSTVGSHTFLPLHHHLDADSGSDLLRLRLCIEHPAAALICFRNNELLL